MMEYNYYVCSLILGLGILVFLIYKIQNRQKSRKHLPDIRVINTKEECKEACKLLKLHCKDLRALGFDCEWRPCRSSRDRPIVSLLQLASPYEIICLFRQNILSEIPNELYELLHDPTILKLGVAPLQDAHYLKEQYKVWVRSTLDLRHLFPFQGGLSGLSEKVLGIKLNKAFQCSDWEASILSPGQVHYAALDALVAVQIFQKWLLNKTSKLFSPTSQQKKVEVCASIFSAIKSQLNYYLDYNFIIEKKKSNNAGFVSRKTANYAIRQKPLYHNCFMHAPDGNLLCSCDRRKAEWYVEKGLAEILPGEPFSIRLLFEPAARATDENGGRYYQQLKKNCCVVCGSTKSYLKHHVIPKEYRKHFPSMMKDHQSHDIVLMCTACHHLASIHDETLRKKLEIQCDAPIKVSNVTQNKAIVKLKNCAKALLTSGSVIPQERKTLLENEVKDFYKAEELTEDMLKSVLSLKEKTKDENFQPHGLKVVNYYRENGELLAFEKMWREHFLECMEPKYLPTLWSVTHNHERVAAKLGNDSEEKKFSLSSHESDTG